MPPAVVPVEEDGAGGVGTTVEKKNEEQRRSCHVAWLAWWADLIRCRLSHHASAALGLSALLASPSAAAASSATVRGTLFLPSAGVDRRVRLFLQRPDQNGSSSRSSADVVDDERYLLVLDLPTGLGGADIAAAGRIVLECRRQWAPSRDGAALLDSPTWLVYCNGRRAGYAARRPGPSDAEGWALEKLRAVTAGAGRLPGGGVDYLRGRFDRVVASSDAESFHLVQPVGWWMGLNRGGGACQGGLSIFFHRI